MVWRFWSYFGSRAHGVRAYAMHAYAMHAYTMHAYALRCFASRVIACVLVSVLGSELVYAQASPRVVGVIVERVAAQTIADELEALGTLKARERIAITANVSDTISVIHFADGEAVAAGDLLVELTDAEESALLAEAQALVDDAKRQFERMETLVLQGSASQELRDLRYQQYQTAQARFRAVRSRLKDRVITAPFAGRVGLRLISPGALVAPGDVITTLIDDSSMKLDFTVPSIFLPTIRNGTPIKARNPAFGERVFEGAVTSVDAAIDPVSRSITVRALLPNPQRELVAGMLMTLHLVRNERTAITVAEEAIIPRGSGTFTMVVDMTAQPLLALEREVVLGARHNGRVEVIDGLSAGEAVVTHGTLKLRSGSQVKVQAIDDGSQSIADMLRAADGAGRE